MSQDEGGDVGIATTVAVWLTALAAAAHLVGFIVLGAAFWSRPGEYDNSLAVLTLLGAALFTGFLAYGAVRMYRHHADGRHTVQIAAVVWLAFAVVGVLTSGLGYESDYGVRWSDSGGALYDSAFALAGLPGVITAFVHGDWLPSLVAALPPLLLLPLVTVLAGLPAPAGRSDSTVEYLPAAPRSVGR